MKKTIKEFLNKEGAYVLGASLFTKVIAFVSSLVLIRILSPSEYGVLSYLLSTLAFFVPFAGGGLQYSFLRFAPLKDSNTKVDTLFRNSVINGFLITTIIALILFATIPFLNLDKIISPLYFYILLGYLFTYFIIEMVKVYYRVQNKNKKFASIDVLHSGLLAFFGCLSASYFGPIAYILAFVLVPFVVGIIHLEIPRKIKITIPTYHIDHV